MMALLQFLLELWFCRTMHLARRVKPLPEVVLYVFNLLATVSLAHLAHQAGILEAPYLA